MRRSTMRAVLLVSSNPGGALALVSECERLFPTGDMGQERAMIEMTALLRLGREAEARQKKTRFRAAYPRSAYLPRLETMMP